MTLAPRLAVAAFAAALMLTACAQTALVAALVPEGTMSAVLGNLDKVSEQNRKRIVELERGARWDELRVFAEQNLEKDRRNAEWWLIAGYARSQLGQHREAADAYGEAVRLEPDNSVAWNLLAQSYRSAGDPRRAINVLNNASVALRDSPMTALLLGETYSDLGSFAEAASAYREAVRIDNQFAAAWFGLARAYGKLGRTAEAKEARARLERLDPKLARRLEEVSAGKGSDAR